MSSIDIKDLDRIGRVLSKEGWRLERQHQRVMLAYPPDKTSAPIRITTSAATAKSIFAKLRAHGHDFEEVKGKTKKKPPRAPVHQPKVEPVFREARQAEPAPWEPKQARPLPEPKPAEVVPEAAKDWIWTDHAAERAEQRKLHFTAVLEAIAHPECVLPSDQDPDAEIRIKGVVEVVVNPTQRTIVTILDADDNFCPLEPPQPKPEPVVLASQVKRKDGCVELPESVVLERSVSAKQIAALTQRVKTSSRMPMDFEQKRKHELAMRDPQLPREWQPRASVWLSPEILRWLSEVVIPKLGARPGKWASIYHAGEFLTVASLAKSMADRFTELEITVRGKTIWARSKGAQRAA